MEKDKEFCLISQGRNVLYVSGEVSSSVGMFMGKLEVIGMFKREV